MECCNKTKTRSPEEQKSLMNRLNRIAGQVNGVKGMLEKDAYCIDILVQVSAINAALNAFNRELLSNHLQTCVSEKLKQGDESVIEELVSTMQKMMK